MNKIDDVVKKETKYIAYGTLILSVLMEAIFLILNKWDYTVLFGNLLSGAAGIVNFLLLGITIQKAVNKDGDAAKKVMHASRLYRMLFMLVVVIIGMSLPCFSMWAVIIPLFFTRVIIAVRPLIDKAK